MVIMSAIITSCGKISSFDTNDSSSVDDPFSTSDEMLNVDGYNYISAGVVFPNPESMTLEYNGESVKLEYEFYAENPCDMGLMIYVDGILQPYTVVSTNETTSMQVVNLAYNDTKRFQIEFTPVCGKKGDELVVVFANIYNAKIVELTDEVNKNTFGNNQQISQSIPWKLKMNADAPETNFNISMDYKIQRFSNSDKTEFMVTELDGTVRNKLDNVCEIEIRRDNTILNGITEFSIANSNALNFYVYGNATGTYRISLYGDFKQIPINGCDYVEVDIEKGQYVVVPFELSTEDVKNYKNLYSVVAPMDFNNFLDKSESIYIVTK